MDGLQAVGRENLWKQPVCAHFLEEIDPYHDTGRFRPRSRAYDGNTTFWSIPSPEPQLGDSFWDLVRAEFHHPGIRAAAAALTAGIAASYPDYRQIVFIAILRAGIPIADWLTRLLPGATAAATSLFCGLGIDRIAIEQVKRAYPERRLLFVDGWTGKGGVARTVAELAEGPLAVLIDPWGWADFAGSREDIFCPSACFTGPATLGFSRTFYASDRQLFHAYLFPAQHTRPQLIRQWQAACPGAPSQPLPAGPRFFKRTNLRLHSNEVCRALINADPAVIYVGAGRREAYEQYRLILELAEWRAVPTVFNAGWLSDYQSRVACELRT